MEYRRLGRSGVLVSPLGLGTIDFGGVITEKDSFEIMRRAIDGASIFSIRPTFITMGKANVSLENY